MSSMTVNPTAIALAAPFLRSLSSARQIFSLYPDGHPNRQEVLRDLITHVQALHASMHGDPTFFVARHSIYLGSSLLSRESLSLFRLVEAMEREGIEACGFTLSTTEQDLAELVKLIDGHRPLAERLGGIQLNHMSLPVLGEEAGEHDLSDLRRAYAMGLEVLRQTALRVSSGKPVDLSAATNVVEKLATEVAMEPSSALLLTTVKSYDEYTYYHMLNVGLLAVSLGQALGLRRDQIVTLGLAGLLHDVGKVHMPEDVLLHVGKLSEEQWRIVQKHPV
ncbi:MAG: HD domain-containing protein, partial [Actinobacteria bacterium]|nr:HD domain-containing protein [Actinomycetota bacterium]